jgi:hypothetical protein
VCALGSGLHHAACSCRPRRVANDLQHVQTQGFSVVELVGADVPSIEVEVAGVSTRGVRRDSHRPVLASSGARRGVYKRHGDRVKTPSPFVCSYVHTYGAYGTTLLHTGRIRNSYAIILVAYECDQYEATWSRYAMRMGIRFRCAQSVSADSTAAVSRQRNVAGSREIGWQGVPGVERNAFPSPPLVV